MFCLPKTAWPPDFREERGSGAATIRQFHKAGVEQQQETDMNSKTAREVETEYLIIGNSAGGIGAAEAIRLVDKEGDITIVSDEAYSVYSRSRIVAMSFCEPRSW